MFPPLYATNLPEKFEGAIELEGPNRRKVHEGPISSPQEAMVGLSVSQNRSGAQEH
jgi:hypothetical protein